MDLPRATMRQARRTVFGQTEVASLMALYVQGTLQAKKKERGKALEAPREPEAAYVDDRPVAIRRKTGLPQDFINRTITSTEPVMPFDEAWEELMGIWRG